MRSVGSETLATADRVMAKAGTELGMRCKVFI
jgi:hypothetical protein